jgi:hypothetical protein
MNAGNGITALEASPLETDDPARACFAVRQYVGMPFGFAAIIRIQAPLPTTNPLRRITPYFFAGLIPSPPVRGSLMCPGI